MAVTRSRTVERVERRRSSASRAAWRRNEFVWTLAAAILIFYGLHLVYQAKTPLLTEAQEGLTSKKLVNLNGLTAREDLLPSLAAIPAVRERQEIARKIYSGAGGYSNVGRIRALVTGDQ